MNIQQIAHDLAVARLYGSVLSVKETVDSYNEFCKEFYDELKSRNSSNAKIDIIDRKKLGF